MKKRIISILLVTSIFFFSLSCGQRASAVGTGTIVAIASIGTLAFSVFTLITSGEAERIANDVYDWIEYTAKPGFDELFVGDGSDLAVGYNQVFQTVKGWFDNGELEIVDGRVKLSYEQFQELYGQSLSVMSKPSLDFQTGFNCLFLNADLSKTVTLESIPIINEYFTTSDGQGISPVYFDDTKIIFSDSCIFYNLITVSSSSSGRFGIITSSSNYSIRFSNGGVTYSNVEDFLKEAFPYFSSKLTSFDLFYHIKDVDYHHTVSPQNCFVYENGTLTYKPVSDVNISGMQSGLIITTAAYGKFLQSIKGFSSSLVAPDDLTDLSDVLPTEYNPSLSFPVEPDLTTPIQNQVIIGNVPGVADMPLSDYQAEIKTDIDVPSIIISKFPFCIPFDFIRFLGILLADPVAPVFHIPISTHPDNLEQWKSNETVGEYLNPDNPMFEIDEEIVIDLSAIPLVQPICYTCFIVGFIFLLLHITPKMIQH